MRSGSTAFLVDTNVLVYAYDLADERKRERAIALLGTLADRKVASLTTQVLGEFYRIVTRKISAPLPPDEAEAAVVDFMRSWPVHDVTEVVVLEAMRGAREHGFSYRDAQIWAAARLTGTPNVLSEDFADGALVDNVRFIDPFTEGFDLDL